MVLITARENSLCLDSKCLGIWQGRIKQNMMLIVFT